MIRTHYFSDVSAAMNGKEITVAGWAQNIRALGKITFIKLRDRTGLTQIAIPSSNACFEESNKITPESVLAITGLVKESKQAQSGWELIPSKIHVLSMSEVPLPLDISGNIESELETRLNSRFMDMRTTRVNAIFMIRSQVVTAIREYCLQQKAVEIQTPKLVGAGAEGGALLFPVNYFGRKAYLSQSPQLYKQEMMAAGLDKVFEIGNYFRAEKSNTTRHVSEFTMLDVELSFVDSQEDVLKFLEGCMVYVFNSVKDNCANELKALNVDLKVPKTPFPRVTYSEAVKMLGKSEGDEIGTEEEKKLGELMKTKGYDMYYIVEFTEEEKPFYVMEKGKYSQSFDLEHDGQELTSGGQREHRYDVLLARMTKKGLKAEDFSEYLQAFRYGMPPHGGFGLGVDRLVQKMLGLNNIREAILHPRDMKRLGP